MTRLTANLAAFTLAAPKAAWVVAAIAAVAAAG